MVHAFNTVVCSLAAGIARELPSIPETGSSLKTDPEQNDGHGCFRSRGGRWMSKSARKPALIKYEGGIRLSSTATDSSNGEAATAMQRLCEPSPSPDSTNGPSSASGSSKKKLHVTFGELPPSVSLLQAQFRQRAAQQEKRESTHGPVVSQDSGDSQELQEGVCGQECEQQLQPLDAQQLEELQQQRAKREQQQAECRQTKRSREESVGLATGSDEEDSAMSRPAQQELLLEQDCAGSKRVKSAA